MLDNWTYVETSKQSDQLGDLEFQELAAPNAGTYTPNNSAEPRVFIVKWSSRRAFLEDLLGWAFRKNGGGISRVLPDPHPITANFWAYSAKVEGVGTAGWQEGDYPTDKPGKIIAWTCAKIHAEYRPLPYAVKADANVTSELQRFVSRGTQSASDYMTTSTGGMKFLQSKILLAQPPGRIIGNRTVTYTWHWVPAAPSDPFVVPNEATFDSLIGKVNSTTFDGKPPGTVLFLGYDPRLTLPLISDNTYYWEIELQTLQRDYGLVAATGEHAGHNYLFDQANGRWDKVLSTTGQTLYEAADLNNLFVIN